MFLKKMGVFLLVATMWLFVAQSGCDCGKGPQTQQDAGEQIPEKKASYNTSIKFITPLADEIVSGQIDVEVEVRDDDGIQEVGFWANGTLIERVYKQAGTSQPGAPHFKVQFATYLMTRGPLSLKAEVIDLKGNKGEKTIQVRSRERWVSPFGAGTINQFQVREDKHLIVRLFRSEKDMNNVAQPGKFIKEGSSIFTTNSIGTPSWLYLGENEEFSPFRMSPDGRVFFGSKNIDKTTNRLIALGKGDPKIDEQKEVTPDWELPLQEWSVKGAPLYLNESLWVHLLSASQAGQPSRSAVIQVDSRSGRERWRYTGEKDEKMEILRGPFLLNDGRAVFFTRTAGSLGNDFQMRLLTTGGQQSWKVDFTGQQLNTVVQNHQNQHFYLGVERQEKNEVVASSVLCVEPATGKECWRKESQKIWPERLLVGNKLLVVLRRPPDGSSEVSGLQLSDGKELWKIPYSSHQIIGFQRADNDSFFVLSQILDKDKTPIELLAERYNARGEINWRYNHKQFYPKSWLLSSDPEQTFWLLVRNSEDPTERFGTRLIGLDKFGKRIYLFSEEDRRFQFMQFVPSNALYLSSYHRLGARIHQIIAKAK